jgi:hypothetical protein
MVSPSLPVTEGGTFALGHKSPSSPQPLRHPPSLKAVLSAGSFSRQAFWIVNETGIDPKRGSRSALHATCGDAASQSKSPMWEVLTARAARRDAPKQMKSVHTLGGLVDGDVAAREACRPALAICYPGRVRMVCDVD